MKWSRYNLLFKSGKYGDLLYNALSNSFVELDRETRAEIEKIKTAPDAYDFSIAPGLYLQLQGIKAIIDEREEESTINVLKHQYFEGMFRSNFIGLTLLPTQACNFKCWYCYEGNRPNTHMTPEVEDKIIEFIGHFKHIQFISLNWLGGEPLVKFDTICRLTEKIRNLGIVFGARITTNGSLLDQDVISKLDDLKIKSMQITLDGPEEVHDRNRPFVSGKGTFKTILRNMENLFETWDGQVRVRVNVDDSNKDSYHVIHNFLKEKFASKNISIYPGILHNNTGVNPDAGCMLDRNSVADFMVEQHKKYGLTDLGFYPDLKHRGCVATLNNGFVIGPTGDIWNCWHDVGVDERKVGSVFEGQPWNRALLSNYMFGTDPFTDDECKKCYYLPVCYGGCKQARLENNFYGADIDTCTEFKNRLPELLEIFYEKKLNETKK